MTVKSGQNDLEIRQKKQCKWNKEMKENKREEI
jgi:hypothetical protein